MTGTTVWAEQQFATTGTIQDGVWDSFELAFVVPAGESGAATLSFTTPTQGAACIQVDNVALTSSPPPAPPPPPAIFSHMQEETYTGTVDCGRGTIQSDATAAGLPTGTEPYTVLLEFKCSGGTDAITLYLSLIHI